MTDVQRPPRPRAVLVAAVLWWLSLVPSVVFVAVQMVRLAARRVPGAGATDVISGLVVLGVTVFIGWVVLRMSRGSRTARFWLAVLAGIGVLSVVIELATGTATIRVLEPVAAGVASALTFLPSVRPHFPKPPPRQRRAPERKVVAWDPNTGEPIRASE
ncbi:hypothetical protein [Curtobacterium sp. 9128]|uniref:hypothetical protein n=1 Tax=Curtobacterium sp. 9128 TaxID=1793722 RepID=UPI0011A35454|nr:hypothetical protein [Curtobacterium sp. 9128]